MNILYLLVFAALLLVLIAGAFFGLLFLTFLVYVISHVYPWLRNIAVWAAKPENLFSFIFLAIVLLILAILAIAALSGIFRILLAIVLILVVLLLFIVVGLGIFIWGCRLIGWVYRQWRGGLVGIYASVRLQTIKFKIKVDVQKETDWKVKWAEMRSKLSQEAEQARRRISRRK